MNYSTKEVLNKINSLSSGHFALFKFGNGTRIEAYKSGALIHLEVETKEKCYVNSYSIDSKFEVVVEILLLQEEQ